MPLCLKPPNGRRVADAAVRVDRQVAGLDAAGDAQAATDVAGPDRPGEAVCRVVGLGDRVRLVVERHDRDDRPEDLLLPDPVARSSAGSDHGRRGTSSRARPGASPRKATSTGSAAPRRRTRTVSRCPALIERAHLGRLVARVGDDDAAHGRLEVLHEPVEHAALHEDPAAGAAVLAGVVEDAVGRARRGELEVGVGEDDVGALAAELEGDPLDLVGRARA